MNQNEGVNLTLELKAKHDAEKIKLTEKELAAHKLIAGEIGKAFGILERHLSEFCDKAKSTDIPLAYVIVSMSEIMKGLERSVGIKQRTALEIIEAVLDGKDDGIRQEVAGPGEFPLEKGGESND